MGLLDMISDPETLAFIAERNQIIAKLAERMGMTLEDARASLSSFEAIDTSEGQTLH